MQQRYAFSHQLAKRDMEARYVSTRPPKGKPGDYIVMQAMMPQIVAISNCPILFNACNNFKLKPLTLEILV